jgi:hypothetical protein
MEKEVQMIRRWFKADLLKETPDYKNPPKEVIESEANLIGSPTNYIDKQGQPLHMPVLDLDFPCELIPSSTPGHFHLYMNKTVGWESYRTMLEAMAEAGVLEEGYVKAAIHHGGTYVRKPGVLKPKTANDEMLEAVAKWNKELE